MTDLHLLDAAETARRTTAGEVSAVEVVRASLDRIAALDPGLNAMSVVLGAEALAEAEARDAALAAGEPTGPLHGVPVVIKEEVDVAGAVTTFGGEGNTTPAAADAEVVRRLRAAGAVVVGKTTMPEFGAWPYTEGTSRGVTRNPWDRSRTPGGSSGGTAVAVATGMAPIGLGGDGGGSIRIPSAMCGLFGLKPQRGRVSTFPHEHLWWAIGTCGPLTRTVLDTAIFYDVIRGNMPGDRFTAGDTGSFTEAARTAPGRLRIGWSTEPVTLGVRPDPTHVEAVRATARLLTELGHDVREVDPRYPDPTLAFVPQFLAGIRDEAALVEHPERLELRSRHTAQLGVWSQGAVLRKAVELGERMRTSFQERFGAYDAVLSPTLACVPPALGQLDGAGSIRALLRSLPMIAFTTVANTTGLPALSVPADSSADGLPIGVQLSGLTDDEGPLLSIAASLGL